MFGCKFICYFTTIDADIQEIVVFVDKGVESIAGVVGTAKVPYNMKLGSTRVATSTCYGGVTTAFTTALVEDITLARAQEVTNVVATAVGTALTQGVFRLLYEPLHPPILDGPCIMAWMWGGVAAMSGFFQMEFIERATSDLV